MVIEATLQLPGVGSVNVSVSCQIKEITGKMRLQFYTTDQLYCSLCFLEQPNMRLDISVNDKNQALVEQQIRKAIRGALTKALVYPSVKIFPLQHALKEDAKKAKKKRFAIVGRLTAHSAFSHSIKAPPPCELTRHQSWRPRDWRPPTATVSATRTAK